MREFKKRYSRRQEIARFGWGAGIVAVLLFITLSMAHAAWGMYGKFSEAAQSDAAANLNLAELKAEDTQVSAAVSQIQTPRGQEADIRETYGLAMPGEGEIDIVQSSTSTQPAPPAPQAWWAQAWHAIFPW